MHSGNKNLKLKKVIPYIIFIFIFLVLFFGSLINLENTFLFLIFSIIYFYMSRLLLSIIAEIFRKIGSSKIRKLIFGGMYIILILGYALGFIFLTGKILNKKNKFEGNEVLRIYQESEIRNDNNIQPAVSSVEIMGMDIPSENGSKK